MIMDGDGPQIGPQEIGKEDNSIEDVEKDDELITDQEKAHIRANTVRFFAIKHAAERLGNVRIKENPHENIFGPDAEKKAMAYEESIKNGEAGIEPDEGDYDFAERVVSNAMEELAEKNPLAKSFWRLVLKLGERNITRQLHKRNDKFKTGEEAKGE
jgi:hypothetical protein